MTSAARQREEARLRQERKIYGAKPDSPKEGDIYFKEADGHPYIYVVG